MIFKHTVLAIVISAGLMSSFSAQAAGKSHKANSNWAQEPKTFLGIALDKPIGSSLSECPIKLAFDNKVNQYVNESEREFLSYGKGLGKIIQVKQEIAELNSQSSSNSRSQYEALQAAMIEFQQNRKIHNNEIVEKYKIFDKMELSRKRELVTAANSIYVYHKEWEDLRLQDMANAINQSPIFGSCYIQESDPNLILSVCKRIGLAYQVGKDQGLCYIESDLQKYAGRYDLHGSSVLGTTTVFLDDENNVIKIGVPLPQDDEDFAQILKTLTTKYGKQNRGNSWVGDNLIMTAVSSTYTSGGQLYSGIFGGLHVAEGSSSPAYLTVESKRYLSAQQSAKNATDNQKENKTLNGL